MPAIDRLRSGIRQYQATTGRKMDPKILEALLAAELETEKSRASENRQYELQVSDRAESQRRYDEQAESEKKAARVNGVMQVGGAALTTASLLKGTALGAKIGLGSAASSGTAASSGAAAASTAAGSTAGSTAAGMNTASLAETYGSGTVGGSYTAGTGTAAGSGSAGGSGAASGGGGASGVGAGIAAAVLGDAMIARDKRGSAFGSLSERNKLNVEGMEYGGVSPGATAWLKDSGVDSPFAYAKNEFGINLTGAVNESIEESGKVVDPLTNWAEPYLESAGTVICTELNRQCFISDDILLLDGLYCSENVSCEAYEGYLKIGVPIAELMKKSKLVTAIVKPFGIAFANEMAHRVDNSIKGSVLGSVILKIGVPVCEFINGGMSWHYSRI